MPRIHIHGQKVRVEAPAGPPAPTVVPLWLHLNSALVHKLRTYAEGSGITESDVVTEALENYFED
jgi:hypothetical protein